MNGIGQAGVLTDARPTHLTVTLNVALHRMEQGGLLRFFPGLRRDQNDM